MRTMAEFLDHYQRQRQWTKALVGVIPTERFDWAPAPGAFSCSDLVRHLMQAEVFWCRLLVKAVAGEDYDPFGIEGSVDERMETFRKPNLESSHHGQLGESPGDCLGHWRQIEERSWSELGAIPDEALCEVSVTHPLTRVEAPLWRMLMLMAEHEAHHRGQLSAYLKMMGVEQPAAALAAGG